MLGEKIMSEFIPLTSKDPGYYYPNRYRAARPWLKELLKECESFGLDTFSGGLYKPFYDMVAEHIFGSGQQVLEQTELAEERVVVTREAVLAEAYLVFTRFGKQIFHFSPILSKMLSVTSVDEIFISDLSLNYDSFYMSFGKQHQLILSDTDGSHSCVDGAFIWRIPDESEEGIDFLSITLTSIKDSHISPRQHLIIGHDLFYHSLLEFSPSTTVGEQLEQDKKEKIEEYDTSRSEHVDLLAEKNKGFYKPDAENLRYWAKASEYNQNNIQVYCDAIKLIINGLCYLTSIKNDVIQKYAESVPKKIREKSENAQKPKDRQRAISKLESMGYTRIHFCGEKLQRDYESIHQRKELPPHWRRGHWRNQACGKQLSERKLKWIKPTIVRSDKGAPARGHLYSID